MAELATWLLEHWIVTLLGWAAICFGYFYCRRLGEICARRTWHDEEQDMHEGGG